MPAIVATVWDRVELVFEEGVEAIPLLVGGLEMRWEEEICPW